MNATDREKLKASAIMESEILMENMSEEKREGFLLGMGFMTDLLVETLKRMTEALRGKVK